MTLEFYKTQMNRMIETFGEKSFSAERQKYIWERSRQMPEYAFQKICEHFISSFRAPPLPRDFVDSIRTYEAKELKEKTRRMGSALNTLEESALKNSNFDLKKFVGENYDGAKTLVEAVNVQIKRRRIYFATFGREKGE